MHLVRALFVTLWFSAAPASAGFYGLVDAARLNDIGAVRALLAQGFVPNGERYGFADSYSPLMWAARHDNVEMITLLLERGAQTEHRDFNGDRALLWAARHGARDAVALLLGAGSPPDAEADPYGRTPLMRAASYNHADIVGLLLAAGADPRRTDQSGETALHQAALRQAPEVVRLLLDAGAEVGAVDTILKETPLHEAAARPDLTVVRLLLDAGAPHHLHDHEGRTPLHIAAWRGLPGHVQAMLDAGADPDLAAADGELPIVLAIDGKRHEVWDNAGAALVLARVTRHLDLALAETLWAGMKPAAALLLDRGASVVAVGREGRPALAGAATLDDPALLERLIAGGADLDRFGQAGLFAAIDHDRPATLGALLDQGLDVDSRDAAGATLLLRAAGRGAIRTADLLLVRGADPQARDDTGRGIEDYLRPPPLHPLRVAVAPELRMRSAAARPRFDFAGQRGRREARAAIIRALIAAAGPR